METTDSLKLKVSVNGSDFEGEGPEETIKEQYKMWLNAVNSSPSPPKGKREPPKDEERLELTSHRAYTQDDEGRVSLVVMPETKNRASDSILLLIYGHSLLNGENAIRSVQLMEVLRQSGLRVDRVDRNLSAEARRFVIKGGNRRGSRYGLNNRGKAYAQDLLDTMFE